ncbi:MAG TPA: type VII secretion-associated serine protease mycosin [Pseudonocardiaceae bacterium]|nr:type VII secretion-associated serine protease mycosin [Pseudonocardiaceae bacterium]
MTRTPHALATRATAITSAALLAVLGPAAAPVFAAQPSGGAPVPGQPGPSAWQAPPVDMSFLNQLPPPNPRGTPDDNTFGLKQGDSCIKSGVGPALLTDRPPAQDMLDIDQAQQIATGKNVTVAVIDTGVNPHPFLTTHNRLSSGGDYILRDGNALVDCDGHGTIVAGIIAADTRGKNTAFRGVAPDARILAIKHTSTHYTAQDNQNQPAGDLRTLAEAIRFAADRPDVKVITMSVDECVPIQFKQETLDSPFARQLQAAIHYAVRDKDKVVVAAAGNLQVGSPDQNGQQTSLCQNVPQNNSPDPNQVNQLQIPPVYSDDVVSVASVDPTTGAPSKFTVWGPWVTIAAPGQFITSVDPGRGGTGLSNQTIENNQPISLQGTSFAAPYVAGVIALVRSRFPNLTARQVMYRIEATAQHPSSASGRDRQVGYGIIDPVAALTAAIPGQNGVPANPVRPVPAVLPTAAVKDWTPTRVALIGSVVGAALLVVTLFVTRSVRRNRVTEDPAIKPR